MIDVWYDIIDGMAKTVEARKNDIFHVLLGLMERWTQGQIIKHQKYLKI